MYPIVLLEPSAILFTFIGQSIYGNKTDLTPVEICVTLTLKISPATAVLVEYMEAFAPTISTPFFCHWKLKSFNGVCEGALMV